MITARPARVRPQHRPEVRREPSAAVGAPPAGTRTAEVSRVSRRLERRRRAREQLLVGLVLLVLLVVTVTLLALSWLDSGTTISSSARAAASLGGAP